MRKLVSFLLIIFVGLRCYSQIVDCDSLVVSDLPQPIDKFEIKQVILPASLMVLGGIGAINSRNWVNKEVDNALRSEHKCGVDKWLRFVNSSAHLAGGLVFEGKHCWQDRFLISATSHTVMVLTGYSLKHLVKEHRPEGDDNRSFPSGHVALAFTGAELLRQEYGTACGIGGYAVATAVSYFRLRNGAHWFHDVVMGAGIGIASARIGQWLLPLEKKILGLNNKDNIGLLPYFEKTGVGLSVAARF